MEVSAMRRRFGSARVARLASVTPDGRPHLVPICFVIDGDRVVTVIDHKPKTTTSLRRLENIRSNPSVALLVDHYDEDWSTLWWVRADGYATVIDEVTGEEPMLLELRDKYRFNYGMQVMNGPAILVEVERWTGWDASEAR